MKTRPTLKATFIAVALAGAIGLTGCSSSSSSDTTVAATDSTSATGEVTVEGAWARTTPMGATMGAAYLTLTSPIDDALTGVAVEATVAKMAQIHEVVPVDGSSMSSDSTMMGSGGTMANTEMKMQEVDKIDLPAGTAVQLKPGGYHIMLMDLAEPLQTGATISITLTFEKQGEKVVEFPVQEDAS